MTRSPPEEPKNELEIIRAMLTELTQKIDKFEFSIDANDPLEDLKVECFEEDMVKWEQLPEYSRAPFEQFKQGWNANWDSGLDPRYVEFTEEPEAKSKPKKDPVYILDEDIIDLLITEGITSKETALFTEDIRKLCLDHLGQAYPEDGGMLQKLNKIFKAGNICKVTKKVKLNIDEIPNHWNYKQSSGGPHNLVTSRCYWHVDTSKRNKMWWMK